MVAFNVTKTIVLSKSPIFLNRWPSNLDRIYFLNSE